MKKTRKFIGIIICISLVSIFFFQTNLKRDIGYLTRPIWDKKPESWIVIEHYYASGIPTNKLCKLHNWVSRKVQPKVFDAVIFSVELDLLEIRLRELWDAVDYFIILESNRTFSGAEKDLVFAENRERFSSFESKLIYRAYNQLEILERDESPFYNENKMRTYMNNIFNEVGVKSGDLIIGADIDEIPYSHTIDLFRSCEGYPKEFNMEMRSYLYSFEFFTGYDSWRANIKTYDPIDTYYSHGRLSNFLLSDAGWHCSFCFRYISDFKFKMTSYSHNDRVTSEEQLKDDVIQEKICKGKDVFDMLPEAFTYKELISKLGEIPKSNSFIGLPKYLLENKNKFAFLLPGGCIRETEPNIT